MAMFDYVDLPPTPPDSDVHYDRGGELKLGFLWKQYHHKTLRFAAKPLDKLLQKIYRDYYKYYNYAGDRSSDSEGDSDGGIALALHQACVRRLNDVDHFIKLFKDAYDKTAQWPESDKTEDQFPPCTQVKADTERRTLISASIHASDSSLQRSKLASAAAGPDASAGPPPGHTDVDSKPTLLRTASAEFPPLLTSDGQSQVTQHELEIPSASSPLDYLSPTASDAELVSWATKRKAHASDGEDDGLRRPNKKSRKEDI